MMKDSSDLVMLSDLQPHLLISQSFVAKGIFFGLFSNWLLEYQLSSYSVPQP